MLKIGFVEKIADFAAKGVEKVACLAVSDPFVMKAWAKSLDITDRVSYFQEKRVSWCI